MLFFTWRTAERLNNKPFGCNKCVNMAQEFSIKCWQFLLEVSVLIWILVIYFSFSILSFFWDRVRMPYFIRFLPYKFLHDFALNPNFNNCLFFAFCQVLLFLCCLVLTCPHHRLPGNSFTWNANSSIRAHGNRSQGIHFVISKYSAIDSHCHRDLMCQWHQMGNGWVLVFNGIQIINSVWGRGDNNVFEWIPRRDLKGKFIH